MAKYFVNQLFLQLDEIFLVNFLLLFQGPKKTTIGDFWRMVWQEDIRMIAMLTKLEEGLKVETIDGF